jgi:GH24 family phage-related lysozyme (muramidase)
LTLRRISTTTLALALAGCAWLPSFDEPSAGAVPAQVPPQTIAAAEPPRVAPAPVADAPVVPVVASLSTAADTTPPAPSAPADTGGQERRPAKKWTTNDAALDIIKTSEAPEGPRLKAYAEGKRWFIGYGHPATRGQVITDKRAHELLRQDVRKCERQVAQMVKVAVTRNEFSAIVSLCHNIGSTRLRKSEVVTYLNVGGRVEAAEAFNEWIYPAGLAPRRKKEMALFLKN